jgi:DNA polymerase-3 subunit alpha
LITLTVMQRACAMIERRHGVKLHLNNIPLDDPKAFELLGNGHTAGVFQVEGGGMTRYLVQMKPTKLDHIIAMVALYRPGPMSFIPEYIDRMHGKAAVEYRDPAMAPIFDSTYGIPVYQEQLMRAAVELAGYTPSESDELRSAISKKKKHEIEKHRRKFVQGAIKQGMNKDTAAGIFADWEEFARYGFNKSHAADYGLIAVQTAYLKANYPAEYMAALLSASAGQTEKVALYAADARTLGVQVQPPDLNASSWDFEIAEVEGKPTIRFGLGAIKNLGHAALEKVLEERRANGAFKDLNDFARRVDLRAVGKRGLECLIKVGALDAFGNRFALLASLERTVAMSANHFRAVESGQMSLFGESTGVEEAVTLPPVGNPDTREMLNWEKELMGLYISDHPLTPHQQTLTQIVSHFSGQLAETEHEEQVRMAGLVTTVRPYVTKAGKPMGFATIEDIQGSVELVLFPRVWDRTRALLTEDQIIIVDGKVDASNTPPKILVNTVRTDIAAAAAEAGAVGKSSASSSKPGIREKTARAAHADRAAKGETTVPAIAKGRASEGTASDWDNGSFPPPPENFPAGWEAEWQPSFDNATAGGHTEEAREPSKDTAQVPAGGGASEKATVEGPAPKSRGEEIVGATPSTTVAGADMGEARAPTPASLYVPVSKPAEDSTQAPKQITVMLRSTSDKERDKRRIKTIHGTLISFHGRDRFSFHIFEGGRGILMDFPGDTTRVCPEMLAKLGKLAGEENWRVEDITYQ